MFALGRNINISMEIRKARQFQSPGIESAPGFKKDVLSPGERYSPQACADCTGYTMVRAW